jgi:DNA-binding transcriptional ArsR family regulator
LRLRLTSGLDLNQSTVSHHLKLLKDAGLINVRAPRHVGLLFPALDARVRLDAAFASVLPVKVTAAKMIIHEP